MYVILDKRFLWQENRWGNYAHLQSVAPWLIGSRRSGRWRRCCQPNREPQTFIWFSWSGLTFWYLSIYLLVMDLKTLFFWSTSILALWLASSRKWVNPGLLSPFCCCCHHHDKRLGSAWVRLRPSLWWHQGKKFSGIILTLRIILWAGWWWQQRTL